VESVVVNDFDVCCVFEGFFEMGDQVLVNFNCGDLLG